MLACAFVAGGVMNLIGSVALYGALIILLRQPIRRSASRASPATARAQTLDFAPAGAA